MVRPGGVRALFFTIMKIFGIYKIQSIIKPRRCYVGSSINIKKRWNDHLKRLRNNHHENIKLQRHYNKYGESDFVFIILEPCLPNFLLIREQYYIDKFNPYFNLSKKASGGNYGKLSEKHKRKISEAHKGRKKSEEHKRNIGNALIDKTTYRFFHSDYGLLECTRDALKKKFDLHSSNLSNLCKGNRKTLKGWKILK